MLGQSKKLQPIWSGPWIVTQVISSVLYRIANRKQSMVAHHVVETLHGSHVFCLSSMLSAI